MLKNHGFSVFQHGGHDAALVGCEEGAFVFDPPMVPGGAWTVTKVLDVPTSDAVMLDFDGDGKMELGVISDFHGNSQGQDVIVGTNREIDEIALYTVTE